MAQEAGRPRRARRAAVRNLDRQGGRGDPRAFGRRAEGNQGHRGADRADPDGGRCDRCGRRGGCRSCSGSGAVPCARKGCSAQGCGAASCSGRSGTRACPATPAAASVPAAAPAPPRQVGRQWPKNSQLAAGPETRERTQRGPRRRRGQRRGRADQQEGYSRRRRVRRREACGPCAPAPAAATPSAAPSRPAAGRAAPSRIRRSKMPSRANGFISATTKPSR